MARCSWQGHAVLSTLFRAKHSSWPAQGLPAEGQWQHAMCVRPRALPWGRRLHKAARKSSRAQ